MSSRLIEHNGEVIDPTNTAYFLAGQYEIAISGVVPPKLAAIVGDNHADELRASLLAHMPRDINLAEAFLNAGYKTEAGLLISQIDRFLDTLTPAA